jgi:hypothetical protein
MNFAGPADPTMATFGIGCRIINVMNTLDVTPITNDSFTTSNDGSGISIDGITFRPDGAFNIPTAVRGRTVTKIGNNAFSGHTALTQISIPATVTSIGSNAFLGCSNLTSIEVDSNNPNYSHDNGVLYNKNKTTLIKYSEGKTDNSFTIPNTVTKIESNAFSNQTNLKTITIPNNVVDMGESVFSGCSSLSITLQKAYVPLAWENWNPNNRPITYTISGGCHDNHTIAYTNVNSSTHKKYCTVCFDEVMKSHSISYSSINSGSHSKYCTLCSYSTTESHTIGYTPIIDPLGGTTLHWKACGLCTYKLMELHTIINGTIVCCWIAASPPHNHNDEDCIECDEESIHYEETYNILYYYEFIIEDKKWFFEII